MQSALKHTRSPAPSPWNVPWSQRHVSPLKTYAEKQQEEREARERRAAEQKARKQAEAEDAIRCHRATLINLVYSNIHAEPRYQRTKTSLRTKVLAPASESPWADVKVYEDKTEKDLEDLIGRKIRRTVDVAAMVDFGGLNLTKSEFIVLTAFIATVQLDVDFFGRSDTMFSKWFAERIFGIAPTSSMRGLSGLIKKGLIVCVGQKLTFRTAPKVGRLTRTYDLLVTRYETDNAGHSFKVRVGLREEIKRMRYAGELQAVWRMRNEHYFRSFGPIDAATREVHLHARLSVQAEVDYEASMYCLPPPHEKPEPTEVSDYLKSWLNTPLHMREFMKLPIEIESRRPKRKIRNYKRSRQERWEQWQKNIERGRMRAAERWDSSYEKFIEDQEGLSAAIDRAR